MSKITISLLCCLTFLARSQRLDAQVVINEIFYHAPGDDAEALEWVELHNTTDATVDLSDWKVTKGIEHLFPSDLAIAANGYVVVCKDQAIFEEAYDGVRPIGVFTKSLGNSGDTIALIDAQGEVVDHAKYTDRAPWPVAADGYSASLERIVPSGDGMLPNAWAPSLLGAGPSGTPGKSNTNYATNRPPIVKDLKLGETVSGKPIPVTALLQDTDGVDSATLFYSIVTPNTVEEEKSVEMELGESTEEGTRFQASIPAQESSTVLRYRIQSRDNAGSDGSYPHQNALRPLLSVFISDLRIPEKIPLALLLHTDDDDRLAAEEYNGRPAGFRHPANRRPVKSLLPPRGDSIMVIQEPNAKTAQVFDYIHVTPRSAGYKVRFHKDNTFRGMTTVNVIFESHDRFVLAEYLAYDLYRRVGMPSPAADFCRLSIGDRTVGYHLFFEQPNRSFLRRNKVKTGGNLYKLIWYGRSVEAQHEKKNNFHLGHEDLLDTIRAVNGSDGKEQWKAIQEHFNVEQVINYFAVNAVLSHWDGYFNNYFAYHDVKGGKWEMYPWDQDKTWGYYDNILPGTVFYNMPITFGMKGDRPPSRFRGFRGSWWRPAGHFSGPLLANPEFRRRFLVRTKEILDTIYTEEIYFPVIDQLAERLRPEVPIRASKNAFAANIALLQFEVNLKSLKTHLTSRRKFLLQQREIESLPN